jgi:hypothetical protein
MHADFSTLSNFLVVEYFGQINFDPVQRRGQLHAVRSGVQSRCEVHNHVRTLRHLLADDSVEQIGARHP